jgi:hypothetical protein
MALAAKTSTEAAGIPQASNVKFVADKGSNDNNGDTAATPYATFQYAVSKLASTGGVIVIVGVTTITVDNLVMDPNEKLITVTSFYNGTDYRNVKFAGDIINPCISLSNGATASWDFYGEYFFDYITFNPEKSSCILAFNYNNFSFGENIETTFYSPDGSTWFDGMFDGVNDARTYPPIVLIGNNRKDGGETISKDINVALQAEPGRASVWETEIICSQYIYRQSEHSYFGRSVSSLYRHYFTYNCSVIGSLSGMHNSGSGCLRNNHRRHLQRADFCHRNYRNNMAGDFCSRAPSISTYSAASGTRYIRQMVTLYILFKTTFRPV